MPIAVSAIVRPSRVHRCLLAGAGLSLFAAALAVGVFASARFHAAFQAVAGRCRCRADACRVGQGKDAPA
jgi:hypothetical protein